MFLFDCSDEILVQIFSDPYILQDDVYHVILTCRRLYAIALPFLYRSITQEYTWSDAPKMGLRKCPPEERERLEALSSAITTHPERIDWVEEADFSCSIENLKFLGQILGVVVQFRSLKKLRLMSNMAHTPATSYSPPVPTTSPFVYLERYSHQLPLLQDLTVEIRTISYRQIAQFFKMNTLKYLRVVKFSEITKYYPPSFVGHGQISSLEKLEFRRAQIPSGLVIKHILQGHPLLKEFIWEVETFLKRVALWRELANGISSAFAPLHRTVERFQLSTTAHPNSEAEMGNCEVDFSGFLNLKVLDLYWRFAFETFDDGRPWEVDGARHLAGRLPCCLEDLTIVFDDDISAFDMFPSHNSSENHNWITFLAECKSFGMNNLSSVTILETYRKHPSMPFNVMDAIRDGGVEWNYPDDVEDIFNSAGIDLKVIRRPQNVENRTR